MSTQTRRELLENLRQDYIAAGRKKRKELLDSLVTATGYNQKYAISLLNGPQGAPLTRKRQREKIYDAKVADALKQVWIAANCICPKRLIPFLPTWGTGSICTKIYSKLESFVTHELSDAKTEKFELVG